MCVDHVRLEQRRVSLDVLNQCMAYSRNDVAVSERSRDEDIMNRKACLCVTGLEPPSVPEAP
jgi:hypothetical protein